MAKPNKNFKEVNLEEYERRHSYNKSYIHTYEKYATYLSLYFAVSLGVIGYIFF
ncbi:hypothetical protein IPJ91_01255 [bacterium]|nr:MAG: hypothetical protein IPJ91_01255 [bacterium]